MQLLALTAVAAMVLYVVLALEIVVLAVVVALILASAGARQSALSGSTVASEVLTGAVLQVWTTRYQTGEDPVLGPDPVSPKESAAARVSRLNRRRYQRMRGQARPAPWAAPPPPCVPSHSRISP